MRQLHFRRLAVIGAGLAFVLGIPVGVVLASHQFSDVSTGSAFHADIDALVDSGVTAGCGGGRFCPSANVTREQMAAFMNRLGALGPGRTPVVNADRLDGLDSSAFEPNSAVMSGSVGYSDINARVLRDPRTGADIRNRHTTGYAGIRIINTHDTQSLLVAGVSTWGTNTPQSEFGVVVPGDAMIVNYDTLPPSYLNLVLVSAGADGASTKISNLTCSTVDVGGGLNARVVCVLTG